VEANTAAREQGVEPGMTESEARARCPELAIRAYSDERVASARHALLDAALTVSPRVEDAAPGLVHVDVEGLGQLIGSPRVIGERLARQAGAVGLQAGIGIAESRTAARAAAHLGGGVTVVPHGREREWLAPAPLAVLDLPPDLAVTFSRWGVRTFGELAALPRQGLLDRLGPSGLRAHDLALGLDPDPFRPYTPPPFYQEAQGLEWEIDSLGGLASVLETLLQRLCARLAVAHLHTDALDVRLQLAPGARHELAVSLAYPMREAEPMLVLLKLELEKRPPAAPVTGVALSARPVRVSARQNGLWQPPAPPDRDLALVLARLQALVGTEKVGAACLLDSRRPDAFRVMPLAMAEPRSGEVGGESGASRLVLRRLRPSRLVDVSTDGEKPARVITDGRAARVVACAGPWRASGEWWDARAWGREEWDVALDDGMLCRLALDQLTGRWHLDAIYD
jgi:protein ImuB